MFFVRTVSNLQKKRTLKQFLHFRQKIYFLSDFTTDALLKATSWQKCWIENARMLAKFSQNIFRGVFKMDVPVKDMSEEEGC